MAEGDIIARPPNPTRDDYEFGGWYSDADLTQLWTFSTPVTENMTLYAGWIDNTTVMYTVYFDSNGGSAVPSQQVIYGGYATRPPDPTRAGYDFEGWYIEEVDALWDFENYTISGDMNLTARWIEITGTEE